MGSDAIGIGGIPRRRLQWIAFPAVVFAFTVVMMGTTLPTPLYPEYARELGFGSAMTTVIFATYAIGVMAALVGVGRFSDTIGRRPMLYAGLVLSLASAVLFIIGGSLAILFVGRVISGFSAGIFTSTATAAVIEAAPKVAGPWPRRSPPRPTSVVSGSAHCWPVWSPSSRPTRPARCSWSMRCCW